MNLFIFVLSIIYLILTELKFLISNGNKIGFIQPIGISPKSNSSFGNINVPFLSLIVSPNNSKIRGLPFTTWNKTRNRCLPFSLIV